MTQQNRIDFLKAVLDEVVGSDQYRFHATREDLLVANGPRKLVLFPDSEQSRSFYGTIDQIIDWVYENELFGERAMEIAVANWGRQSLDSARQLLGSIAGKMGVEIKAVRWGKTTGHICVVFQSPFESTGEKSRKVCGKLPAVADKLEQHGLRSADLSKGRRSKRRGVGVTVRKCRR